MVMRRRLAALGSLAIAFGIVATAPSCGSGFLDGLSGGKRDGGSDAAAPVDAPVDARTCSLHRPPLPPPPDIKDSELPGPVVLALDAVRIDDSSNIDAAIPPSSGYDLDLACTCPEPDTCVLPPDAGPKKCDGDGGADNALGRMFSYLGSIFSNEFGPDFATRRVRKGAYGSLMSLGGWNHEANDPKVIVAFFLSHGLEGSVDGGKAVPQLDGTDVWTIDPASVQNGEANLGADCNKVESCFPLYVSRDAYVVDNTLVARMNIPFAISTSSGRIVIDMEDVVLTGKLTPSGSSFRIDGEFVGRWPVDRVLKALAQVPVNDQPLCEQAAFFEVARQEVCAAVDITSDPAMDHTGKRCDALSAAIRYSGGPAKLGQIYRPEQGPTACAQFVADCPK